MKMHRPQLVSLFSGIGAAIVVALVGPLWGGIIVILATPLVFLTVSRILFGSETEPLWGWYLVTAGLTWFALLPVAPIANADASTWTDFWPYLIAVGAAPLLVGLAVAIWSRRASLSSRDIR